MTVPTAAAYYTGTAATPHRGDGQYRDVKGARYATQPTGISDHSECFPNPRLERTKKHLLIDILTIGLDDIATFGQAWEAWLRTFLAFAPRHP